MIEIFLLAAGCIITGIVIGYKLCLYVHRPRVSKANRRWLKWRKSQPNCAMCSNVADGFCWHPPDKKSKVWWCGAHFVQTHQPIQGTWPKQFRCEHPDLVGARGKG